MDFQNHKVKALVNLLAPKIIIKKNCGKTTETMLKS